MANSLDFDDPAIEQALFRYGLIASLVHHPPAAGRLEGELRALAAQTYTIPYSRRQHVSISTVRRYLRAYLAHSFEALLSRRRSDAGRPRAFDVELLKRAIALREQQPGRTTPMLLEILEREGQHANAHTLDTHLRKAGKTRKLLRASATPHIRFERDHVNALWQSDVTDGSWLPDPARPDHMRRTHLIAFLDDHFAPRPVRRVLL